MTPEKGTGLAARYVGAAGRATSQEVAAFALLRSMVCFGGPCGTPARGCRSYVRSANLHGSPPLLAGWWRDSSSVT